MKRANGYLYVMLLAFFLISCKQKDVTPDCNNPQSVCQQIVGLWYENCHVWGTYHQFGSDGKYSSAPFVEGTYKVDGNVVTTYTYKNISDFTVKEITSDSVKFTNRIKWCKCSPGLSGSIEGLVNGQLYSDSNSYKGENFYDASKQYLQLIISAKGETGWKIIINQLALNSISFPYQVPADNFNIYLGNDSESVSLSSHQGCTMQITSMDNNICKGTFSGEIYYNSAYIIDTLDVTDGKFSVEFEQK